MMKSISIIGKGAWGRALHHVIAQNRPEVRILGRGDVINSDIVILAVPTQSLRALGPAIRDLKNPILINTAKGIEEETHFLPQQIMNEFVPDARYFTLIGPGFAGEVMRDMPTLVNLGYGAHASLYPEIVDILQTDTFRIRPVEAIPVLELSSALKNIYAIGCGLADGLGYETNTRIQLVVLAIEEAQRLFTQMKLSVGVGSTAGTIGDLVLTCNSSESRNFQFGRMLATHTAKKALDNVDGTVEGYGTLESIKFLEKKSGITLPLAQFIRHAVINAKPAEQKKNFASFIKQT